MLPLMTGRGGLLGAETENAFRNFLLEFKLSAIDFFLISRLLQFLQSLPGGGGACRFGG